MPDEERDQEASAVADQTADTQDDQATEESQAPDLAQETQADQGPADEQPNLEGEGEDLIAGKIRPDDREALEESVRFGDQAKRDLAERDREIERLRQQQIQPEQPTQLTDAEFYELVQEKLDSGEVTELQGQQAVARWEGQKVAREEATRVTEQGTMQKAEAALLGDYADAFTPGTQTYTQVNEIVRIYRDQRGTDLAAMPGGSFIVKAELDALNGPQRAREKATKDEQNRLQSVRQHTNGVDLSSPGGEDAPALKMSDDLRAGFAKMGIVGDKNLHDHLRPTKANNPAALERLGINPDDIR